MFVDDQLANVRAAEALGMAAIQFGPGVDLESELAVRGALTAEDYEDRVAADPRIDTLREKMEVIENSHYSRDYLDPGCRSVANAMQVRFRDGSHTPRIEVEYPLGHPRRRTESLPLLRSKAEANLNTLFPPERVARIMERFQDFEALAATPAGDLARWFVPA